MVSNPKNCYFEMVKEMNQFLFNQKSGIIRNEAEFSPNIRNYFEEIIKREKRKMIRRKKNEDDQNNHIKDELQQNLKINRDCQIDNEDDLQPKMKDEEMQINENED